MMVLNTLPETSERGLSNYYQRCADEGVVFSGPISGVSFGMSENFDPAWSVASVCWCAGGSEKYMFRGQSTIQLKAGAVLTIGERERYAFSASGDRSYLSSMISFSRDSICSLRQGALSDPAEAEINDDDDVSAFRTRLFRPGKNLISRMNAIAVACQSGTAEPSWHEEQTTLLAAQLLADQKRDEQRPDRLDAVKRSTRDELARRLRRAVTLIYDCYDDPSLDLSALAREACIARYHFVRVFTAAYGITPLRYLGEVRMDAAARLLESLDTPIAEIAQAVGFSNRSAFQRRFHRHFGATPAKWRMQDHGTRKGQQLKAAPSSPDPS